MVWWICGCERGFEWGDVGIVLLFAFACGFSGYCGRHSLWVLFVTANLVLWLVGGLL